jgi:tetratricopeptide (TPR) repeat protein
MKDKYLLSIFAAVAVLFIFGIAANCESIKLKNGTSINAKIIAATTESITIESYGNRLTYPLSEIDLIDGRKITYSQGPSQAGSNKSKQDQQRYVNHLIKGQEYLQNARYSDAVSEFKSAIAINSNNVSAYSGVAAAYLSLKEFENAINYAGKGISKDPDFPNIYGIRAQAYLNLGNLAAAKDDFLSAKKILENPTKYPANEKLLQYVDGLLDAIERQKAAIAAQNAATGSMPETDSLETEYWLHLDQGRAYARREQHLNAIDEYESAISLKKDGDQVYVYLGQAYEGLGRNDKAKLAYEKAVTANPNNKEAYYNLAILYSRKFRDNQSARRYLEDAIGIDSEYAEAYHNLGILYSSLGMKDDSAIYLKRAIEIFNKKGQLYNAQGVQKDLDRVSKKDRGFGLGIFSLRNIIILAGALLGLVLVAFIYPKFSNKSNI